jgi:hypothetical protein
MITVQLHLRVLLGIEVLVRVQRKQHLESPDLSKPRAAEHLARAQ